MRRLFLDGKYLCMISSGLKTKIMKQLEYKTIGGVLLRLRLKYQKWCVMNEIRQLDFDMQCGIMTYKQYKVDYEHLSKQYDNLK